MMKNYAQGFLKEQKTSLHVKVITIFV